MKKVEEAEIISNEWWLFLAKSKITRSGFVSNQLQISVYTFQFSFVTCYPELNWSLVYGSADKKQLVSSNDWYREVIHILGFQEWNGLS